MLSSTWSILCDSAVFILVGFMLAGVLEVVLSGETAVRLLSGARTRSVFLATAIGVPLPLCSCSVLPTALTLRRKGAGKGATVAFLISTPETSVTSILLTYALLGPFLAVFRPIAACVTALTAGLIEHARERRASSVSPVETSDSAAPDAVSDAPATRGGSDHCCGSDASAQSGVAKPLSKLRRALRFAFVDLFDDIFGWMILGILVAAAIQAWLPQDALTSFLGGPLRSSLIMVAFGVPLYVCAEASTPVAAALIAQGLNPGAALVFLLVGPATNIGSLGLLRRELGGRAIVVYLATIIIVSIIMGFVLDAMLTLETVASPIRAMDEPMVPEWAQVAGAILFLVLGAGAVYRKRYVRKLTGWLSLDGG